MSSFIASLIKFAHELYLTERAKISWKLDAIQETSLHARSRRGLIFGLAILPFLAFALYVFFSAFSKSNLFIGWDTPSYIYSVRLLQKEGLENFLRFWWYNRFPYSLILYSLYSIWPSGLFTLARILPTLLAFAVILLVGLLLSKWFNDNVLAFFGVVFSCVWLAPYILASNLFSQLLSLVLSLLWLTHAFKPQTNRARVLFYTVFLIAAISHVYTMIFLYIVFIVSNLTTWLLTSKDNAQGNARKQFVVHSIILGGLIAVPLIVSTVFMGSMRIFGPLLNPQQIEESGIRQISSSLLFISFGGNAIFIIPITLLAVCVSIAKAQDSNERLKYSFILWWTVIALILPLVSYIFPYLLSLTERMIIITPVPILLALFARDLSRLISQLMDRKIQRTNISRVVRSHWMKLAVSFIIVISIFVANINPIQDNAQVYLKSFITQDMDNRLQSLRQNIQFTEKPLFIINVGETLIADYADLWDNTIGAYLGPHYTYLGPMQNLVNLRCTAFNSTPCDILSKKFFSQLNQSGTLSYQGLSNRPIIILDTFYVLRQYETPYVENITEGVFLVDFKKLWTNKFQLKQTVLDAYMDLAEKVGPWYGIKKEWSSSPYILELNSNVSDNEFVSYRFYAYESAVFSLKIRYFDFAGYNVPIAVNIDGETVGHINYNGTITPQMAEAVTPLLPNGWHELSLRADSNGPLVVNLDYIIIEPK